MMRSKPGRGQPGLPLLASTDRGEEKPHLQRKSGLARAGLGASLFRGMARCYGSMIPRYMGPVVSSKFRKDVPDVALHRFFGER